MLAEKGNEGSGRVNHGCDKQGPITLDRSSAIPRPLADMVVRMLISVAEIAADPESS